MNEKQSHQCEISIPRLMYLEYLDSEAGVLNSSLFTQDGGSGVGNIEIRG